MKTKNVISMGCRLNAFEAEIMRKHVEENGLKNAMIVNTCAVTAEAERQSRQTVRRVRRENPGVNIIVTGCAAQLDPQGFASMPSVNRVIGNVEKLEPKTFKSGDHPIVEVADIMTVRETATHLIDGFDGRTRAFVQIQQGCNHRCTFCIIPFARGPNRSVPMDTITEQIQLLVDKAYSEVVLTGVDIASYGADLPGSPPLSLLVRKILTTVPQLKRLRLSSVDPAIMDEGLFKAFAEEDRLMPHLHLSLQAMDDMVLKRMKRRHSVSDAFAFAERVKRERPDVIFGADLITGFPTEDDVMFENTISKTRELGVIHYHVFPYSERSGTPAARMPSVPKVLRRERAEILRQAGAEALSAFLNDSIGSKVSVLLEQQGSGFSEHYTTVQTNCNAPAGTIVNAVIKSADAKQLYAK